MYIISADCVEEIDAQRVLGYALFKDEKDTRVSYPLESFEADVSGRSFHNGRFIQRMREKAASLPKYVNIVPLVCYALDGGGLAISHCTSAGLLLLGWWGLEIPHRTSVGLLQVKKVLHKQLHAYKYNFIYLVVCHLCFKI